MAVAQVAADRDLCKQLPELSDSEPELPRFAGAAAALAPPTQLERESSEEEPEAPSLRTVRSSGRRLDPNAHGRMRSISEEL